jgi:hypothetical protein
MLILLILSSLTMVAIIVGESALHTNVQYIPEETIILLGNEPEQVKYMDYYAFNFQTAKGQKEWITATGPRNTALMADYLGQLLEQARWWLHEGEPTALTNPALFKQTQALAREKAFIPWYGDITSEADMKRLGAALRKFGATVTLLNLSNVIPYSVRARGARSFSTAADYADMLAHLPMTSSVPILTTGYGVDDWRYKMLQATGPFYGLDDLRYNGGDSEVGLVALDPESRVAKILRSPVRRAAGRVLDLALDFRAQRKQCLR